MVRLFVIAIIFSACGELPSNLNPSTMCVYYSALKEAFNLDDNTATITYVRSVAKMKGYRCVDAIRTEEK